MRSFSAFYFSATSSIIITVKPRKAPSVDRSARLVLAMRFRVQFLDHDVDHCTSRKCQRIWQRGRTVSTAAAPTTAATGSTSAESCPYHKHQGDGRGARGIFEAKHAQLQARLPLLCLMTRMFYLGLLDGIGGQSGSPGLAHCFAFFVPLGSAGAAGKIWKALGNRCVSRRVPLA